ncbi:MAG: oxygenase [Deltaproteobacteria bacterium]|nr:oxygenase [Deltaproteobacteria bacterium]
MKRDLGRLLLAAFLLGGCSSEPRELLDCLKLGWHGFRRVAGERAGRFQGKVQEETARCRGGEKAVALRRSVWVDWQNYWAAGDAGSKSPASFWSFDYWNPNRRGINGALLDLIYERIELIEFNLFDNSGTYESYVRGRDDVGGVALAVWNEMRLPEGHPQYQAVGGAGQQLCQGELIRFRTLTGICNDIRNPRMGSTHEFFARNVQFEATFPDLGKNELARNRHGDRLGLLKPDPQVISRRLFTRAQPRPEKCREGRGLAGHSPDANCAYKKAPFFNVLAAFWIQFMTHDWFSHLEEGHNSSEMMPLGCATRRAGGVEKPLSPEEILRLGCRPNDRVDRATITGDRDPPEFTYKNKKYLARAYKTTRNTVTAWWDASQIYGYDETSRRRVKRDPSDPAKLLLVPVRSGEKPGYLPVFDSYDPINPQWAGQEAAAFPDNWTIGLSFFHNVFAREHNLFVDEFRKTAAERPDEDSGLRNPAQPDKIVRYRDVSADELFHVARLVIAAEIAKIHTLEWTTQLLYNEPLYLAMNGNWSGLFHGNNVAKAVAEKVSKTFSTDDQKTAQWYSILASADGILGTGSRACLGQNIFAKDERGLKNPDCINGGINHFGSPFNFPEEFVTVYRLHPMVPDLIDYREWDKDPNIIQNRIPVVETFRGQATRAMRQRGLVNWGLSMGRQRLGLLTLQNHPQFLQNLELPRLRTATGKIDVAALDIVRDRERGVPRFNEFRRQYGLKQLTSFDDFVDHRLPKGSSERAEQERLVGTLRELYGQHRCDASKIITTAQVNDDGTPINDCLAHPDGSMVDNIEDVDTVVGWLSEFTRPHGFAISETQFQVFVLNASRRLFSDRFFTSSFRPEFYTHLGIQWVTDNGPGGKMIEKGRPNGHEMEVSPLKRVLLRTIPELARELEHVVNIFDPWARERGEYYSLAWRPRKGAESDETFKGK